MVKKSVDSVDNAVRANVIDYAVLSPSNKPIVKNEKLDIYLLENGYKFKKKPWNKK